MAVVCYQVTAVLLWTCTYAGAFLWSPQLSDGHAVSVCSGWDLVLPWNFTLSDGEDVSVIQWYYQGSSEEMVAMVNLHGQFIPMPAFAARVQFIPGAGLQLQNVSLSDSGNFTVEIVSHAGSGGFATQRLTVGVDVAEPPLVDEGLLKVTQERGAVYVNETGQWAVQLTCGRFSSLGHPPVDVVWTTPAGESVNSTSYEGGIFHLTVDNPVKGGNYTCSFAPDSRAASCLDVLQQVNLNLDEVGARLTLIEANTGGLGAENARLNETNHQLEEANFNLTSYLHNMTSYIQTLDATNANLTSYFHGLEESVSNLTGYIQTLEQSLAQCTHDKDELMELLRGVATGPCAEGNYTVLEDDWRDVNNTEGDHCDNHLTPGWYAFSMNGSKALMPTSCVTEGSCGTAVSIWLDLQGQAVPGLGQEIHGRTCGVGASGCCSYHDVDTVVRGCGTFYVYHLQPTRCNHAFCAALP